MEINAITIPQNMIKNDDLVIIPRREYEDFLGFRLAQMGEVELTVPQKKVLTQARKNLSKGKYLTFYVLKQKLGIAN